MTEQKNYTKLSDILDKNNLRLYCEVPLAEYGNSCITAEYNSLESLIEITTEVGKEKLQMQIDMEDFGALITNLEDLYTTLKLVINTKALVI